MGSFCINLPVGFGAHILSLSAPQFINGFVGVTKDYNLSLETVIKKTFVDLASRRCQRRCPGKWGGGGGFSTPYNDCSWGGGVS